MAAGLSSVSEAGFPPTLSSSIWPAQPRYEPGPFAKGLTSESEGACPRPWSNGSSIDIGN
jgi:hypothetical protein